MYIRGLSKSKNVVDFSELILWPDPTWQSR